MKKYLSIAVAAGLSFVAHGSDPNTEGKQFATDLNNTKVNSAAQTVNPADVPNYAGSNPAETGYYSKGATIEQEAAVKAASDPNAQFISGSINNRPQTGVTESDPLFKRQDAISANAHGLSNTYAGCVDLPVGTKATSWNDQSCSVTGARKNINFACEKTVRYECTNQAVNERDPFSMYDFGAGGWNKRGVSLDGKTFWFGTNDDWRVNKKQCVEYSSTISLNVDELDRFGRLNITHIEYDDWVDVIVNGKNIFSGRGPYQGVDLGETYTVGYRVAKPKPPIEPPEEPPVTPDPPVEPPVEPPVTPDPPVEPPVTPDPPVEPPVNPDPPVEPPIDPPVEPPVDPDPPVEPPIDPPVEPPVDPDPPVEPPIDPPCDWWGCIPDPEPPCNWWGCNPPCKVWDWECSIQPFSAPAPAENENLTGFNLLKMTSYEEPAETSSQMAVAASIDASGMAIQSAPGKNDRLVREDDDYWYYEYEVPYDCEYGANFTSGGIDIRSHLVEGSNTITIVNRVGGGGGVYLEMSGERLKACVKTAHNEMSCDAGQTNVGATLLSSICIENALPNASGYNMGGCSKYKQTYTKLSAPIFDKAAQCSALEAGGCEVVGSECISKSPEGYCLQQQLKYRCPNPTPDRQVSMCGSQLVCPDGNCTADVGQNSEDATDDFKEAATGLAVAQEIAKYANEDELKVFTGQALKCHDSALGYSNCCNDSGWGVGVGLASCSSEEKTLGLAKEAGKTVYVGSYKSGFLGTTKYKVYCSFPSKLARIIMEQGKPQIPSDFGGAKNPNCEGLSLNELQNINFDVIDFSEFYPDVMLKEANSTKPVVPDETKKIENKIKAITGGGN